MGNLRWIRRTTRRHSLRRVVEIGAGDGRLLGSLAGEATRLVGIDLVPRPSRLDHDVQWIQGDALEALVVLLGEDSPPVPGRVSKSEPDPRWFVLGNMILHHFREPQLRDFGRIFRDCGGLCFCEPWRSQLTRSGACTLWPLVNHVTRHDMMTSIRAGFRAGELTALLGLDPDGWEVREQFTWRGAHRLLATRKP